MAFISFQLHKKMVPEIHSSLLKYRLKFFILSLTTICLINSCSKKTAEFTEVIILNKITGLPEQGERIQLYEVKEKDLDLTTEKPYKYTFIEEKISDNYGKVYFDKLKLKHREKFKYYASWVKKEGISYSNYIHVKDEVEIDKYNGKAINDLIIAPSMKKLVIKALNVDEQVIKYKIQSENEYLSLHRLIYSSQPGLLPPDTSFATIPYLGQWETYKENTPMGRFFITIVKFTTTTQDTLRDTIFCPRDQDYLYEFEF
jgi:hypothetical protein